MPSQRRCRSRSSAWASSRTASGQQDPARLGRLLDDGGHNIAKPRQARGILLIVATACICANKTTDLRHPVSLIPEVWCCGPSPTRQRPPNGCAGSRWPCGLVRSVNMRGYAYHSTGVNPSEQRAARRLYGDRRLDRGASAVPVRIKRGFIEKLMHEVTKRRCYSTFYCLQVLLCRRKIKYRKDERRFDIPHTQPLSRSCATGAAGARAVPCHTYRGISLLCARSSLISSAITRDARSGQTVDIMNHAAIGYRHRSARSCGSLATAAKHILIE